MRRDLYYIVTIIAIGFIAFFFYNKNQKAQDVIRQKDSVIAEKNGIITYHTNKEGLIVAQKEAAVLRAKDLEESYPKIYEQLEKSFDIKVKNLKAYIQNEFAAHGSGEASVVTNNYYDTATNRMITKHTTKVDDGFLNFESTQFDSLKQVFYEYTYTDTASTAIHGKKKWMFGNEKLYASTVFQNPNASINGTTNILVDDYKDKRFVISAGISYAPFADQKFQPTISFGYALFKF